jgi:hypothetical protein
VQDQNFSIIHKNTYDIYAERSENDSHAKIWQSFFYNFQFFLFLDKQIDLSSVDLKKLKVKDLKKILSNWDEECDGCLEKGDYIKRIEELKPKHMKTEL